MGCFGAKEKPEAVLAEHKFAYINLADFKSKSCVNFTAYVWIYIGTLISLACYVADLYTAVILLAFNRWTNDTLEKSSIVNFDVAKIVFSVCIFFSFVLLAIDWFLAIRVIKSDGIAEAYMNVIAIRFNCIWGGKGKGDTGWKRFLVFSRLTDSRGLVDYLALFTYFAFKGWVRIIFAEGPRVVINALTFISVTKADAIVKDQKDAISVFEKFGQNVEALYAENKFQVIILGTMAFTTIMWVLAILRLLLSSIIYICYLWHSMDGKKTLRKYCKDRIDTRMGEIVQKKHNKALNREKQQKGAFLGRQPTIPVIAAGRKDTFTSSPNSMSSTANLLQQQQPLPKSLTPPPIYMSREPTLTGTPELPRANPVPNMGAAPANPRKQPPAAMWIDTSYPPPSVSQDYHGQTPHQGPPPQQQYSDMGSTGYGQQPRGDHRQIDFHHQQYQGGYRSQQDEREYHMQPLAPVNSGRTTFVTDRLARNNSMNGRDNTHRPTRQLTDLPGRFPISPREPVEGLGWSTQPPVQRSQTAGPPMQRGGHEAPPPRSQTTGPMQGYGPPSRNNMGQHQMQDGYDVPPPRNYAAGVQMHDGYGALPPRSQTAGPQGGYGAPPPRGQTAGPQGGYGASPPRSQTTGPQGGYGASPPPRSQTAGPTGGGYGAPPPRGYIDGRHGPPPRSQTAAPIEGGYGPPPRGQTQREYYEDHEEQRQNRTQGYAGKPIYQPATQPQGARSQTAGPPERTQFGPPPRTRTEPAAATTTTRAAPPPQSRTDSAHPEPPRETGTEDMI